MTKLMGQARIEDAMNRREIHRKWLAQEQEKRNDFRGTCQKCGHTRVGTLALLRSPCEACGHGSQSST